MHEIGLAFRCCMICADLRTTVAESLLCFFCIMANPRIDLITIGDELLLGLTPNGHLTWLGEQFNRHGAPVRRNFVILDEASEIREHFQRSWEEADLIVTTGGLGPTSDDRTRDILAECLGIELLYSEEVEADIRQKLSAYGMNFPENNKKQAFYLEGSEILHNGRGTAPGLWYERDGKVLVMLPGPPRELHPMWTETVLPKLIEKGLLHSTEWQIEIRTTGVGESALEDQLQPLLDPHPGIQVAFCAHPGIVDVRLNSQSESVGFDQVRKLADEVVEFLGENFLAYGQPELTDVVLEKLAATESTLAIFEEGSGGVVSHAITDKEASTGIFLESSIQPAGCSDDIPSEEEQKQRAEAIAMQITIESGADYGVAVLGQPGVSSAVTPHPKGWICVGIYHEAKPFSKTYLTRGTPKLYKERCLNLVLDTLRRRLS